MTQVQEVKTEAQSFFLTPPEVIKPSAPTVVPAVPLADATKARLTTKVEGFVNGLLGQDLQSDEFRKKLDDAFTMGRAEIAAATSFTNDFTQKNFAGELDSPAYKAISQMRTLFDDLNPARQGDLFAPNKFLGIKIPFGSKLTSYLRRYESAGKQINAIYGHIQDGKVEVEKTVSILGDMHKKFYDNILQLEAVVYFMTEVETRISAEVDALKLSDPSRAKALEKEVLYYVNQNLGDVLTTKALTINAYNVAGELRRTGREVLNGCDRVSTLGLAALGTAVMLARATGVQLKMMEMLVGAKQSIEDLVIATGQGLNDHVKATTEFSANPLFGVQKLQEAMALTNSAMDMMDNFRSASLVTMKTNNEMVRVMNDEQMKRIQNERQALGLTN